MLRGGVLASQWIKGELVLYPGYTGPGTEYFVNPVGGSDANNGLSWESPFATIAAAVSACTSCAGDTIYIAPSYAAGAIVVITENVTCAKHNVGFIGINSLGGRPLMVNWSATGAGNVALTITGFACRVCGINYKAMDDAPAVRLSRTAGAVEGKGCLVDHCIFVDGKYGIDLHGAPDSVVIRDNVFEFIHVGANNALAIYTSASAIADPYRIHILNNVFNDCDGYIDSPLNSATIKGNVLKGSGHGYTPSVLLDLAGGNDNTVTGNHFGGDYSHVGGYQEGAGDDWVGNTAEDLAEAEVADNGFTIAVPT